MFLPSFPRIERVKKAFVFMPFPEWKHFFSFFKKFFPELQKFRWMDINFCYFKHFLALGPVMGMAKIPFLLEKFKELEIEENFLVGWAGSFKKEMAIPQIFIPEKILLGEIPDLFYPLEDFRKFLRFEVFFENKEAKEFKIKIERFFLKEKEKFLSSGNLLTTENPAFIEKETKNGYFSFEFPEIHALDMEIGFFFYYSFYNSLYVKIKPFLFLTDYVGETTFLKEEKILKKLRKVLEALIWEELKES